MKKFSGIVILLICTLTCAQQRSAGPLAVKVFSTRTMRTLTATPLNARDQMRFCRSCAQRPVTRPLRFQENSAGMLTLNGTRLQKTELTGVFRMGGDAGQIVSDGIWKVRSRAGHLQLLLTLDSERYVALALSGEAAPDEPMESLKALAVVIRTFALRNTGRHGSEGFNLCDSTHCQALRYGRSSPAIEQAVLETSGETLWEGRRRAQVFYTQNCGGMTEAAANVWPGLHAPYLMTHADPYCVRHGPARWQADISVAEILAIFHSEHWSAPPRIDSARVVRRTASGRAQLLEFQGGGKRVLVSASSFRFAVDRSLRWNRLRSDWYTIASTGGGVHIRGQGYGHGVGLCQAGAHEMAAEGKSYRQILAFYFPGTSIGVEGPDGGWRTEVENGWTLDWVGSVPEFRTEAIAAWSTAQKLFPVRTPVRPTIRIFPDTELFRESSEEPGWVLAVTRGTEIFTQPPRVLARRRQTRETLRHEFLHVLVEQEASRAAPLWLREGLVEALSQRDGSEALRSRVNVGAIDTALAHPENYTESFRAHEQAGALARALMAAYGLQQVRGWLQSGVPDETIRRITAAAR